MLLLLPLNVLPLSYINLLLIYMLPCTCIAKKMCCHSLAFTCQQVMCGHSHSFTCCFFMCCHLPVFLGATSCAATHLHLPVIPLNNVFICCHVICHLLFFCHLLGCHSHVFFPVATHQHILTHLCVLPQSSIFLLPLCVLPHFLFFFFDLWGTLHSLFKVKYSYKRYERWALRGYINRHVYTIGTSG